MKKDVFNDVLNDCLRCHKIPYETESSHWHYCYDCVKTCVFCKEFKPVYAFSFDFKSEEYKRWKASNCFGFTAASGHVDTCIRCEQKVMESLQPLTLNLAKESRKLYDKTVATNQPQLELMLEAMKRKSGQSE